MPFNKKERELFFFLKKKYFINLFNIKVYLVSTTNDTVICKSYNLNHGTLFFDLDKIDFIIHPSYNLRAHIKCKNISHY